MLNSEYVLVLPDFTWLTMEYVSNLYYHQSNVHLENILMLEKVAWIVHKVAQNVQMLIPAPNVSIQILYLEVINVYLTVVMEASTQVKNVMMVMQFQVMDALTVAGYRQIIIVLVHHQSVLCVEME